MKERPILLREQTIKDILSGREAKIQRVVKPCPDGFEWTVKHPGDTFTNILWNNGSKQWQTRNIPVSCDCLLYTGPMQRCVNPTGSLDMEWFQWESTPFTCPDGQPGDRLWVRETWATGYETMHCKPSDIPPGTYIEYKATPTENTPYFYKWRPSIFMPRWASRINLEITNTKLERVQDADNNSWVWVVSVRLLSTASEQGHL